MRERAGYEWKNAREFFGTWPKALLAWLRDFRGAALGMQRSARTSKSGKRVGWEGIRVQLPSRNRAEFALSQADQSGRPASSPNRNANDREIDPKGIDQAPTLLAGEIFQSQPNAIDLIRKFRVSTTSMQ